MKLLTTFAAGALALGLLLMCFVLALIDVTLRGGKAMDCGLESEEDAR